MVYFLDTNIFLRSIVKEDTKSSDECTNILKKVKENKVNAITSNLVVAEIAWTLLTYYKFSRENTIEILIGLKNLNGLIFTNECNIKLAIEIFSKHKIKLVDCMIASIKEIQDKKMTIVSYDKEFDKLGVIRKEPQAINK